ncbi:hypothetical protein GCM10023196_091690 [Actinoallomurus vinaceus]|uniref:Uncharacterized protein n=1 Tax=Actinoallomurus vinaceus TaxID=1080074 RepID=A0ABP8UT24_9ACTN
MITPEELSRLDPHERAALLRALIAIDRPPDPLADPRLRARRRRGLTFLLTCCVLLIPWIVFLVLTLPVRYTAGQWQAAWTGFDIALLLALAATAWAIWRKRQLAIFFAVVTGTLLLCDAWFDVMLSWGRPDLWMALLTAALGELPMAMLLFMATRQFIHHTVQVAWAQLGMEGPAPPFRRVRLFTLLEETALERRIDDLDSSRPPS